MRYWIQLVYLLSLTSISYAQSPGGPEPKRIKVAFLIYPEVALLDYTGPLDVFVKANRMTANQYDVFTVSADTALLQTQGHVLETKAEYTFGNAPRADVLIVPGARIDVVEALGKDSAYANFVRRYTGGATLAMSVCTGSFILGELGMLDGHRATTHWVLGRRFAERFPDVEFVRDVPFVDEGDLITTSGVTTGIDGALHLVGKYSGEKIAAMVGRGLQYESREDQAWPEVPAMPMHHADSEPVDD